jgi:hypothetical protein
MALTQVASGLIASVAGSTITGSQSIPKSTLPTGCILQVVQNTSGTEYNINAVAGGALTAWTQLTNFSVTITPTSATSKILLTATIPWYGIANGAETGEVQALWYRNSTQLNGGQPMSAAYIANNTYIVAPVQLLDSPATTSSITYYIYGRGRYISVGQYAYNRGGNGTVILIAQEVAA